MNEETIILHDEVEKLLPWFVNGTLDEKSQDLVRKHLADCPVCKKEYEWLCSASGAISSMSDTVPDIEPNLQKMLSRIGAKDTVRSKLKDEGRSFWPSIRRQWFPIAFALQMVFVFALGTSIFMKPESKQYDALASMNAGKMKIAIVFRSDITVQRMQEILRAADANIVEGPTVTFAYVVEVPYAEGATVVRHFKVTPEISLVQSLNQGSEN